MSVPQARSQRNHIACCYHAWLSLKVKAKALGKTLYKPKTIVERLLAGRTVCSSNSGFYARISESPDDKHFNGVVINYLLFFQTMNIQIRPYGGR